MAAIGSFIVMGIIAFPPWFPAGPAAIKGWLPAALADAGQLARVRHLAHADAAQAELAQHGARATALRAAGVAADLELRLGRSLDDQSLLGHHAPFNRKPTPRRGRRP